MNSYLAAKLGSPRLLEYCAGNANAIAGVFDKRHGPCADLLVFDASRTLTTPHIRFLFIAPQLRVQLPSDLTSR